MAPKDSLHLENIIEYANDLDAAFDELSIDYDSFCSSVVLRGTLAFFVEHIGEEAGKLSTEFKKDHPEMDWEAIVNFRHHIVHEYHGVIAEVLWDTAQNDVPELKAFCQKILKNSKN
ncbi:DUF86 domain-containing protein [Candidatus Saccharibacteria bacterium]|nr:DUF86 domain-containing protein [Candidatus Saccharibacteria bacterium]